MSLTKWLRSEEGQKCRPEQKQVARYSQIKGHKVHTSHLISLHEKASMWACVKCGATAQAPEPRRVSNLKHPCRNKPTSEGKYVLSRLNKGLKPGVLNELGDGPRHLARRVSARRVGVP